MSHNHWCKGTCNLKWRILIHGDVSFIILYGDTRDVVRVLPHVVVIITVIAMQSWVQFLIVMEVQHKMFPKRAIPKSVSGGYRHPDRSNKVESIMRHSSIELSRNLGSNDLRGKLHDRFSQPEGEHERWLGLTRLEIPTMIKQDLQVHSMTMPVQTNSRSGAEGG